MSEVCHVRGVSEVCHVRGVPCQRCVMYPFLGAACGSPYIVFILRFCCMASCYGKIYIYVYIYIIREATVVLLH